MENDPVYTIESGFTRMDFDAVTKMLAEAYWSPGIKKEEVLQGAKNSALLVGAFTSINQQIGYARAVSDKTRFAYIMDVFVKNGYRKLGIGQKMVSQILNHPDLKDVYQWVLITQDAHGVYKKLGFKPLSNPDQWMEIRKERPVR